MGDKTEMSISPIFYGLMGSLTSTAMGQTWHFVRENGKIASRKCDEDKGTIVMNMELDDYAMSFKEDDITFHNMKEFISSLGIQGFPKVAVSLTRQPYRGTDSILIKQGRSNIYHRLSSKDRYSDRYGFDDYADIEAMVADDELPKMLCFDLDKATIQAIYEKASTDGVVINFTSESDKICEFTYDMAPTDIIDFENTKISPETRFPYNFFHIIRSIGTGVRLYVFGEDGRGVLGFTGTFVDGNVSVKFNASCPSRI
jgi:hypothetical protein